MSIRTKPAIVQAFIESAKGPLLVGFLGSSYALALQGLDVERMCRGRIDYLPVSGDPSLYHVYSVRGLPTYVLYHNNREIGRHLGRLDLEALDSLMETALGAMQCPI
ncbi:MAG: TlpA family protein disulfide reductase [Oceanidesulfovibrio sp.]